MPTNRHRRTRNRVATVDDALTTFFKTGVVTEDSDLLWDIFGAEAIFRMWSTLNQVQKTQCKLANTVFESRSRIDSFAGYSWLNRRSYQQWKANNAI